MRTALLLLAAAAVLALRRQAAASVDASVLDARDAWAAGDGVDAGILDARDAWAASTAAAAAPWIDQSIAPNDDGTVTQYDAMGNVIATGYAWGDGMTVWNESLIPAVYLAPIRAAERTYALPKNMLARLLWQESHYRPDIISGATVSAAGALGIAQFMPATAADLGIDPRNALQSIDAAGRYLASLYRATGLWSMALAAYNWGLGNLRKYGLAKAPAETRAYYQTILADIGISSTMA